MKTSPIKILMVENDSCDARLVSKILAENEDLPAFVEHAQNLKEGLIHLKKNDIDLVLLDLYLSDSEGLNAFVKIRDQKPNVPVIVISGFNDDTLALEAVRQGAQDYLIKDQINTKMLARVIRHAIERKRSEEAFRDSEQKLQAMAENLPDLIIMVDQKGTVLFVNHSKAYLPSREQLIGTNITSYIPSSEHARCLREIEHTFKSGEIVRSQYADSYGSCYLTSCVPVWQEGKITAAMIVTHDITEAKRLEEISKQQEEFRRFLVSISTRLINLEAQKINEEIHKALGEIGEFLRVDRAYVFLFSQNKATMTNTHEWCSKDIKPQMQRLKNLACDSFSWFLQSLQNKKIVNIPRVADLPKEASFEKAEFEAESIQSLVCLPMRVEGEVIGFVGFDSVKEERQWSEDLIALLAITSDIFANALERKYFEETLSNLNECLISFTPSAKENINRLLEFCGKTMGADCVLFNRIQKDMWYSLAQWNPPPDFTLADKAENHICYYVVKEAQEKAQEQIFVIRNLPETRYAKIDAAIQKHGLKTYVGYPIKFGGSYTGILCMLYKSDFAPRQTDKKLMGVVAAAIAVEEERRRVQEALIESEARFKMFLDHTRDWETFRNKDGKLLYVSPSFERITGYRADDYLSGKINLRNMIFYEDIQKHDSFFSKYLKGEPIEDFELRMVRKDGQLIYVSISAQAVINAQGEVLGFRASARDITERKSNEEALRQSENRYKHLLKSVTDYIYTVTVKDQRAISTYHGPGCAAVTGYASKDYETDPHLWYRMVYEEDRDAILEQAAEALRGENVKPLEHRIIHKDGSIRWVKNTVVIRKDEKGNVMSYEGLITDITQQKQAEEALRESEARLRTAMESLPFDFFIINKDGRYIVQNTVCREHWGDLIGKHPYELSTNQETLKLWQDNNRRAFLGEVVKGEVQLKIANNERFFYNIIAPVIDKDKIQGILGLNIDITERKLAEEALRESEGKYRLMADHIPLHLGAIDQSGKFILWNKYSQKIFGYSDEETIGKLTPVAIHESEQDAQEVIRQANEKGIFDGELNLKRKDGSLFPAHLIVVVKKDSRGRIVGFYAFAEDITDRKEAEEALRKSETLLRTIFDTIPLWVFVKDRNSKILFVNKKMADDYGVGVDKFINLPTRQTPAGNEEERAFSEYVDHQVIETGELKEIPEEAFLGPDDKTHYLHTIKVPLKNSKGYIVGLVGVSEDITERKKQQAELDNYRQHLEELVDERTRELRQSERLAATGRLAASIAHEINNPLQGIITHLELMQEAVPKNSKKIKNFEFVKNNIWRIKSIVTKLLDMYKIGDDSQADVDINELLKEAMALIQHQCILKGITLESDFARNLPKIKGWRQQLHQVFLNLIINAQDSMKGKGKIIVTTTYEEPTVSVKIGDTGEGIKKEDMESIFDPFFTTKKESGTGLGLFICQGIVKEHRGEIKVKSEVGKGSTFTVLLPTN